MDDKKNKSSLKGSEISISEKKKIIIDKLIPESLRPYLFEGRYFSINGSIFKTTARLRNNNKDYYLSFIDVGNEYATKVLGGREKEWIKAYVLARHEWLGQHRRPAVRASAYRTRDLGKEVNRGNWDLAQLPIMANGSAVYPK